LPLGCCGISLLLVGANFWKTWQYPQNIAIPDELKAVKSNFGGMQTKIMLTVIKRMVKRQFIKKVEEQTK
jgi:hypothetical protein